MSSNMVQHGVLGVARSAGRLASPRCTGCNNELWRWPPRAGISPLLVHRLPPGQSSDERCRWISLPGWADRFRGASGADRDGRSQHGRSSRSTPELLQAVPLPRPPAGLVRSLADKRRRRISARRSGVPTPPRDFPMRASDLVAFPASNDRVPRRVEGYRDRDRGLRRASRGSLSFDPRLGASDRRGSDEALVPNVMLQEYIPGVRVGGCSTVTSTARRMSRRVYRTQDPPASAAHRHGLPGHGRAQPRSDRRHRAIHARRPLPGDRRHGVSLRPP